MKDYTIVEVLEDKMLIQPKTYTVGDVGVPHLKILFKHLFGETTLNGAKLQVRYDLPKGFIVDEYTLEKEDIEFPINPKTFYNPGWIKIFLVLKKDIDTSITIPGEISLRVRNVNISNEEVEPVYDILINKLYDETFKYLKELDYKYIDCSDKFTDLYTVKYSSLNNLYLSTRKSLEEYMHTAESGGNANSIQGHLPRSFARVESNIDNLINSANSKYREGDVVELLCSNLGGNWLDHKRKIENSDDGSGIRLSNGLWANMIAENRRYVVDEATYSFISKENKFGTVIDFKSFNETKINSKFNNNRKNVLLKGDSNNIKTTLAEDIHVSYTGDNKGKSFSGKINTGFIKKSRFLNEVTSPLKIVILGDSISQGKDWSNVRFGSGYKTTLASGINNKDHNSNWTEIFAQRLITDIGIEIPITVYNRSIPGRSYGTLQTQLKNIGANLFNGQDNVNAELTWYENVMACNPDMIILSMGMNHNDNNHYNDFITHFYDYIKHDVKFKNGLIQFAVLTTPNPKYDFHENSDFSTYDANASKIVIQQQQRRIAKKLNGYIIDAGRASTIFRYGFDPCNYTISNRDILETATNLKTGKIWNKGVLINDYSGGELKLNLKNLPHAYVMAFSCNFKQNFLDTKDATFRFLPFSTTMKTVIQFVSVGNGQDVRVCIYDLVGGNTTPAHTLTKVTGVSVKIEVLPDFINVYIDGNLACQQRNPIFYKPYNRFEITNDTNVDIVLHNILEWQPARYEPCMFETEMWAINSKESEYGQANEDGYGGGVNHPSTLGVSNVYNLAILEFIGDLLHVYKDKDNYIKIQGLIGMWQKIGVLNLDTYLSEPVFSIKNMLTGDSYDTWVKQNLQDTVTITDSGYLHSQFRIGFVKIRDIVEVYINCGVSQKSMAYQLSGDIVQTPYSFFNTEPSGIVYSSFKYKNCVISNANGQRTLFIGNGKIISGKIKTSDTTLTTQEFDVTFDEPFIYDPVVTISHGISAVSNSMDSVAEDIINVSLPTKNGFKVTIIMKGVGAGIGRLIQWTATGY